MSRVIIFHVNSYAKSLLALGIVEDLYDTLKQHVCDVDDIKNAEGRTHQCELMHKSYVILAVLCMLTLIST